MSFYYPAQATFDHGAKAFLTPRRAGPPAWEVAKQDAGHVVVRDPVEPFLRVNLGREVGGEEPVAVEPARGHQREDAEGGIAEAEPFREILGEDADAEIDQLNVVLVDAAQLLLPGRIAGQLLEAGVWLHVEHAAKGVVARHAQLAGAQDVGCGEVLDHPVFSFVELQVLREVVEHDGARVGDARTSRTGRPLRSAQSG